MILSTACSGGVGGNPQPGLMGAGPGEPGTTSSTAPGTSPAAESTSTQDVTTTNTGATDPVSGVSSGGAGSVTTTGTETIGIGGAAGVGGAAATSTVDTEAVAELEPFAPAPASLPRLTVAQFNNSLGALLGDVSIGATEPDHWLSGFATVGASKGAISPRGVEQYEEVTLAALDEVFADEARRSSLVGCDPGTPLDLVCAETYLARFGRLAWRRPLSAEEATRVLGIATSAAATLGDSYEALKWASAAILQSPKFLYRIERGEPSADFVDRYAYTPLELASKLAFFIWNSTPDAALLDAAEAGELADPSSMTTQLERLLTAPGGRQSVGNFAREFVGLYRLDTISKDPNLFPNYTPNLADAMQTEFTTVWESAAFDRDVSALDLLTSQTTFVNRSLGELYGIDVAGLSEDNFSEVQLPATSQRAGILTSAALLSLFSNQKEGSPTLRGVFIREHLLCDEIPAPPPGVDVTLEDPPEGVTYTKRERLAMHQAEPACAGCHALMDPLGFGLEYFDAIGARRETDSGKPIDATGSLDGAAFDGALELGTAIADSPKLAACLVKNFYNYANGREALTSEAIVIADLAESFAAGGHRLKPLVRELAVSDGFRFVAPPTP